MNQLFFFIEQMCIRYNIDESHGLKHAKGTYARAQQILLHCKDVTNEERRMALYAAALHDTCDHKYTDVKESSKKIREWLLLQGWVRKDANSLIKIITTMSYSKLKANMIHLKDGTTIALYPDHGKWQRAYHVARHADLLEAFIVARCVLYDRHSKPEKSEEEHWQRAIELFNDRVFRYVKDDWLFMPEAQFFVPALEKEAFNCLVFKSMDWPEPHIQPEKN